MLAHSLMSVLAFSVAAKPATVEEAKTFTAKTEDDLKRLWVRAQTAEWIKSTYITDDTGQNAAWSNEDVMAYLSVAIKDSQRFKKLKLDPDTARQLYLLSVSQALPAPSDPKKRGELAGLAAKLEGAYGKGKFCTDKDHCKDLLQLSDVLTKGGKYEDQLAAWEQWHTISKPMRPDYARLVELSNEGAREIGWKDLGELWRASYDMSPADFEKETDRLWTQLKPLYDQLHCYVREQLAKKYPGKVNNSGPIPAFLLGNMWAQDWSNIYPLVEPYPNQASLDVTAAMKKQGYDELKMVHTAENFFVSLGMPKLPPTFWERSQFKKPADRDVVCHASAWDVHYDNDLRIKMCIKVDEEDLITLHHELGHDYYYTNYYKLPVLYQQGANDGFHEAIGDALTLSITPAYLKQLGLIDKIPDGDKGLIDLQMKRALEKIAFMPFGRMIDQWRWDVFSGKTPVAEYNKHWWELRLKYQGIAPASVRDEQYFDPGAKYHIPANVPYMRYFLALILQFQFHRALCKAAGYEGPLHACSIYGNKAAGEKLQAMLAMGASKPWPEALKALSGETQMDASAVVDYFQPLMKWLETQNQGKKCGW
ncbi:MAG: M2 family metallopeptidase [Myxococcaceae bacterium]